MKLQEKAALMVEMTNKLEALAGELDQTKRTIDDNDTELKVYNAAI